MPPSLLERALSRARAIPRSHLVIAALAVAYTVFLSYLCIQSHRGLKTVMNDMGNADQALWEAAHGELRMPQSNDIDGVIKSRFGIHANFIFLPLSILYRLRPDPEILLVLTSACCAAAALGIYAFARARLHHDGWAAVAAAAFLASPTVHDANLFDFHVVTLMTALLVWAIWAFETERRRLGFALLVLAMSCKEDVALLVIMLGAYLVLSKQRRLGMAVSALGALYFVVVTGVVVPAINHGEGLDTIAGSASRYAWLGGSVKEMIVNAVTDPGRVLGHMSQPDRLRISVYLLLSGGIVALRSYRMLLVLVPHLLMGLLANTWMNRVTGTYYWMASEAVVVLAVILAAEPSARERRVPYPLVYLAAATAVLSLLLSPLPTGFGGTWDNFAIPPERPTLDEVRAMIPSDASISVQNNLGPQLSQRHDIASYPRRADSARFVLFHLRYPGGPDHGTAFRTGAHALFQLTERELVKAVHEHLQSREWGLRAQGDGYYLFERGAESAVPFLEASARLEEDSRILYAQIDEAVAQRRPWAFVLVIPFTWRDVGKWLHLVRPDATNASNAPEPR